MAFRFEKLEVWQKSIVYYCEILRLTDKFPRDEIFGLTSQLRRAVMSVSLNIAEGSGRPTKKEFKQFLGFAQGSLYETISNLFVCRERKLLNTQEFEKLYTEGEVIGKMISSLRSSLE